MKAFGGDGAGRRAANGAAWQASLRGRDHGRAGSGRLRWAQWRRIARAAALAAAPSPRAGVHGRREGEKLQGTWFALTESVDHWLSSRRSTTRSRPAWLLLSNGDFSSTVYCMLFVLLRLLLCRSANNG